MIDNEATIAAVLWHNKIVMPKKKTSWPLKRMTKAYGFYNFFQIFAFWKIHRVNCRGCGKSFQQVLLFWKIAVDDEYEADFFGLSRYLNTNQIMVSRVLLKCFLIKLRIGSGSDAIKKKTLFSTHPFAAWQNWKKVKQTSEEI